MDTGDNTGYVDNENVPGGMISDYSDEYESHYWVKSTQLGMICDTSSSQFGTGNVYVTNVNDNIYNSNLDPFLIDDEIQYDSGLKPYDDSEIDGITDPEKRFKVVLNKIFNTKDTHEFQAWKQNNIQDYLDDLNSHFPDSKLKM